MTVRIEPTGDMKLVREMLEEYGHNDLKEAIDRTDATHADISFQRFARELATLPYEYDPILVALSDEQPAGCVALRRIDDDTCEMKRLYVRPAFRGKAVGRALAEAVIAEARRRSFQRMRLDTLPPMREAMALYEALGFIDIAPYRDSPIGGSRYMELDLTRA